MIIGPEDLINEFYEEVQEKYPDISRAEIDKICRAPFNMVKETIAAGEFEGVRLQYLFSLKVSPQTIIRKLKKIYNGGTPWEMSIKYYRDRIFKFIRSNPEMFDRYKEHIKEIVGNDYKMIYND